MMNLSSLSKLQYANYAHLLVILLSIVTSLIFFEFQPMLLGFSLINILIAVFAYRHIRITIQSINKTSKIVNNFVFP